MWNIQDTFETGKWLLISAFSICVTVLLCYMLSVLSVSEIYIEKKFYDSNFGFYMVYTVVLNASY